MTAKRLKEFLESERVPFITIVHDRTFTAEETANSAHVPEFELAKTVVVEIDGRMAMVVLPANRDIMLEGLRGFLGTPRVRFATEGEFKKLFPDCEVGAMPPFGNLYGMDVYIAPGLYADRVIEFNAGTHTEVVKMAFADFERLVHPRIVPCEVERQNENPATHC